MSVTITGLVIAAVSTFLKWAGHSVPDADLVATATTIGQIFGGLMVYVGRVRKGDITWWGKRVSQ